jgi:hypothetical protein
MARRTVPDKRLDSRRVGERSSETRPRMGIRVFADREESCDPIRRLWARRTLLRERSLSTSSTVSTPPRFRPPFSLVITVFNNQELVSSRRQAWPDSAGMVSIVPLRLFRDQLPGRQAALMRRSPAHERLFGGSRTGQLGLQARTRRRMGPPVGSPHGRQFPGPAGGDSESASRGHEGR